MARLDVYAMPGDSAGGLMVDVQASMLEFMDSRIVVPLLPASRRLPSPIRDLHPLFDIEGQTYVLATQAAAAVPKRDLRIKIGSLDAFHDRITRALDILLLGF